MVFDVISHGGSDCCFDEAEYLLTPGYDDENPSMLSSNVLPVLRITSINLRIDGTPSRSIHPTHSI